MNEMMNGYKDGLNVLDDIKEQKRELEGMADGVTEAGSGMNGLMGLTNGGKNENGNMELANGPNADDSSSDSQERASDDSYSIGSFFSDLQSFGGDAAEMLEESKKFFTKLGAVVAIIGTCINTATSMVGAIQDGDVKIAVFTGFLLIGIQIPTTLAMLYVFLKEWVKATVAGFFKAKKELEELASDLDSFIDDSESEETGKNLIMAPSDTKEQLEVEMDGLKTDLEKTKKKNVQNLQTSDPIEFSPALEEKTAKKTLVNDVYTNGEPDKDIEQRIRAMEEGDRVSEEPENCATVPGTSPKRQLPRTPSSDRDRPVHKEYRGKASRPVQTSSRPVPKTSKTLHSSSKAIENTDRHAPKRHTDTPSKGRNVLHKSSSRVNTTNRQMYDSSGRLRTQSTKNSDPRRGKSGTSSTKRTDPSKRKRSYEEKLSGSGWETTGVHRSKGKNSENSRQRKSDQASRIRKKKLNSATQTIPEAEFIEAMPAWGKNVCEDSRETNNAETHADKQVKAKCWNWLWHRGSKK